MARLPLRLLLACALSLAALPARAAEPRPNVLVVLLDDVGSGDLGSYGGALVRTPVLDALAAEGMRFTQAYSGGPMCSPSRAALLTGEHPIRFGIRNAIWPGSREGLPAGARTLADYLHAQGYATGHFGKWHLGTEPEHSPTNHGFDRSVVLNRGPTDPLESIDGGPVVAHPGHQTAITTDHAIAFVDEHAGGPFFAYVSYLAGHTPYQPPPEWLAAYAGQPFAGYAAEISYADAEIGRLLAELDRLGIADRTLVIVSSDNGGLHGEIGSNGSLRGRKADVFEGGIRVPLIARWKGRIAAGSVNDSTFAGIDAVPTIAELAGAAVPASLPGRSLAPALLTGARVARATPLFWETADASGKPIAAAEELYAYAVREGDWKLVFQTRDHPELRSLFDLASDPGETTNLATAHPDVVARLERLHRAWRARAARIDPPLASATPGFGVEGGWTRLGGDAIELAPDERLAWRDGDFGFRARVVTEQITSEQVLLTQAGRFSLVVLPGGAVRLRIPRNDPTEALELTSASTLRPGVATQVAFGVFGRSTIGLARLFLDGHLEAEGTTPGAEPDAGNAPLRIGNGRSGLRPFRGLMAAPRLFRTSLVPSDLVDSDLDGVPDASDDCSEAPNGPDAPEANGSVQRDEDGDGVGTACDPDFDGDGAVGSDDVLLLQRRFGARVAAGDPDARLDLDADGAISFRDVSLAGRAFGLPPGPSAAACRIDAPCLNAPAAAGP